MHCRRGPQKCIFILREMSQFFNLCKIVSNNPFLNQVMYRMRKVKRKVVMMTTLGLVEPATKGAGGQAARQRRSSLLKLY